MTEFSTNSILLKQRSLTTQLFTTQFYAVNNSRLEYVFIEFYNGGVVDLQQILKHTNKWKSRHNIVFCDNNSVFWKAEINKLIDLGYLDWKKFKVSEHVMRRYKTYKNVGTVPIFNLPQIIEENETDQMINYINELIDNYT